MRILRDCSVAFVCGFLPKDVFLEECHALRKGDYDDRNKYYVKADCFNVTMTQLWSAKELEDWWPEEELLASERKETGHSRSSARFYTSHSAI